MIIDNKQAISIGILAHVDAGKTTVTEQLLYHSGTIKAIGRVDTGNTVTDSLTVEKERGITVRAATVSFEWKGQPFQLLDTPGHVDFIAEVERALSVLDAAVLVISAREGVQAQTKVIFNALVRLGIPTVLYVNKIDRMGVDLDSIEKNIREQLSTELLILQEVHGESTREATLTDFWMNNDLKTENIETLSMHSDTLFEQYTSTGVVERNEWEQEAIDCFRVGKVFPLLYGSALHGLGIEQLLDLASRWMPSVSHPLEEVSAYVYKVDRDGKNNRRCFVKLYGGALELRKDYDIYGRESLFKVRQLFKLKGAELTPSPVAFRGDIVVLPDSGELKIGDWLGTPAKIETHDHLAVPTLKAHVPVKDLQERRLVLSALEQLTDEDPFLDFSIHPVTEHIEVKLFGVVQREIVEALLKQRYGIELRIEEPATLYKERPIGQGQALIEMYRNGNHLPATIGFSLMPLPIGSGIVYTNRVSYGDLMKPFQNAVYEGALKGLETGLKGWAVTDCEIAFIESAFDSVNSTPSDFRKLAPDVVAEALRLCETELLEPIMTFEIHLPNYALGRALSDVLKMRGTFEEPQTHGEFAHIRGILPVDTSKNYMAELADFTEGKGLLNLTFKGYQPYSKKE